MALAFLAGDLALDEDLELDFFLLLGAMVSSEFNTGMVRVFRRGVEKDGRISKPPKTVKNKGGYPPAGAFSRGEHPRFTL
jgi:hypothetical protein